MLFKLKNKILSWPIWWSANRVRFETDLPFSGTDLMKRLENFPEQPRVLLLKLDHIGDFVLAMRPMQQLRKAWPNAKITLVCGPWNTGLAAKMKIFDSIVGFTFFPEISRDSVSKADDKYILFQKLDLGSFDLAIDLRYEQDTRPLLDCVTASFRAGYYAKNLRCSLDIELPRAEHYSKRTRRPAPLHTETQLALLVNAIITTFRRHEMHPIQDFRDDSQIHLGLPDHRFIVIAPTAGKTTCQWPLGNFVSLCKHLIVSTDVNLILVGHKRDIEGTREIIRVLPPTRFLDLVGKLAIEELPALLFRAELFIGNNAGTTHMAAQMGTPTICIYSGAFDHRVWQPLGSNVELIRIEVACSPCGLMQKEECPFNLKCLMAITPKQVFETVHKKLEASLARSRIHLV